MAPDDAVKAAIDELSKVLSIKSIIGEPIEMEDKIILPVTKIGVGFGTGIGHGVEDKSAGGIAGSAGGGGGIFPVAVVVIFKGIEGPEGIRVMPLGAPSEYIGLAESMTQIASTVISKLTPDKEISKNKHGVSYTSSNTSSHRPSHTPSNATRIKIE